jgi:DNA polymerase-3 subunit chi
MKSDTEVNFYSITYSALERPLTKLVEKIYDSRSRLVLKVKNSEEVDLIGRLLWSYSPITFLAHGNDKTPYPEKQPIFITCNDENPNNAEIAIIFNHAKESGLTFSRIIYFFNGNDEELQAINVIRQEKHYKTGHIIKCYSQDEAGVWVQAK